MSNDPERRITDADVAAIVDELRAELARQFYDDLGRGIWSALKTLAIAAALAVAAWGYKAGSGGH
jgi:hypothetical protein